MSAAGLVIVGLAVVIVIFALGRRRGTSPTGGTDGVVDSSDRAGTGGPRTGKSDSPRPAPRPSPAQGGGAKQEAAYRKPTAGQILSALEGLGDEKYAWIELGKSTHEQTKKSLQEMDKLPGRIRHRLPKQVRIILKYNGGPGLTVFPSEHPAIEPIQRDLGPPEAKGKGYYKERAGWDGSRAEVRDGKPETGDYVPLAWLKYGWIEFGVVGGKVVVVRLDCVAAARDLPK